MTVPSAESLNDLVGAIPSLLGYHPARHELAVAFLAQDHLRHLMVTDWPVDGDTSPHSLFRRAEALDTVQEALTRTLGAGHDLGIVVVGYDRNTQDHVLSVRTDIDHLVLDYQLTNGGHVRTVAALVGRDDDTPTYSQYDPRAGAFSTPQPLSERLLTHLSLDGVAAAIDRASMIAQHEPLSTPTWESVTPTQAHDLDKTAPSERARRALAILHDIARPRADLAALPQAEAAHLLLSHPVVRDVVITRALSERSHYQGLIQLYRGAPPDQLPDLAAVAAAASLYTGGGAATDAILAHAATDGPHASLAEKTRAISALRQPAPELPSPDVMEQALTREDLLHTVQRSFPVHAASQANRRSSAARPGTRPDHARDTTLDR